MSFLDFVPNSSSQSSDSQNTHANAEVFSPLINNPDAVFTMNAMGEIVSVNKTLMKILGYENKDFTEFNRNIVIGDVEKVEERFLEALSGVYSSFDTVISHKNGYPIPMNITLIPTVRGKTTVIFGLCKDLTSSRENENKINQIANYLKQAEETAHIGTWDHDFIAKKTFFSSQIYKIFGMDESDFEISTENLNKFFPPLDQKRWEQTLFRAISAKEGYTLEHQIIKSNGEECTVLQHGEFLFDDQGNITHLIGTLQDITERKIIEEKLLESEQQLQSIADHLYAGIWSLDVIHNQVTFCSQGVTNIYGVSTSEFIKERDLWERFIHPEDKAIVRERQEKLWRGEELIHQYRIIDANGQMKWVQDQTLPYLDKKGNVIRLDGIITDITEEKNYSAALAFLADHDPLTQLPNRRLFERKIHEEIHRIEKSRNRIAVFYLNFDRFKNINDTIGHELGDKMLIKVSERLRGLLPQPAFLARVAGDEFAIGLMNMDKTEEAITIADKMIREMELPFYVDDYELYTSASIGISFYPIDGKDSQSLVRNASKAMRKAKEFGGNDWRVYSSSDMNISSFKLHQLERDMRKAIKDHELFLEYQPKVNCKTGKIEGAEALIRWKHPEWGIVSPNEFLPLAEENGLIFKMGDWVLKEVCTMLEKWQREGIKVVPISVNVSPLRILKADYVNRVKETIKSTGIDPSLIELEITESAIIKNTENAKRIITELKDFNVRFALDDFGTGYSSLSYLKDLQIDTLKIDKSFIDGIEMNKANESIIKGVIFLANELGVQVVAEGVEGHNQLNFLLQQDCPVIQGYIYSRPVQDIVFKKMLQTGILKPIVDKGKEVAVKNRRAYFRLNFDFPLCGAMTIIKFRDQDVRLGKSRVLIENISLGGLCYLSNINLPIQKNMIIKFTLMIFGKELQLIGKNVWKLEENGIWRYGFMFHFDEGQRNSFAPILNQLTIQLKKDALLPGFHFLQGDKFKYLKG
jgi:diguanylate cyclase (GGDEF)-like protein/PAS domain S-box-containing protein